MRRRNFLRQLLITSCGGVAISSAGCGTILHSERIHEPHSRDIDWEVAALNGLGLALFFVPGVLAFVVDFYTGAIYLPPAGSHGYPVATADSNSAPRDTAVDWTQDVTKDWQHEALAPEQLNSTTIEHVVRERTGREISLSEPGARVSKLASWRNLAGQVRRHLGNPRFGLSPRDFFANQVTS